MKTHLGAASLALLVLVLGGCPTQGMEDAGDMADVAPGDDVPSIDSSSDVPRDAPPEPCGSEGMMRTAACGNCGLRSERCERGVWTMAGPCIGEGECAAATTETRGGPRCGTEARICDDMCMWTAWDEVTPGTGACTMGEMRTVADGCAPGVGRVERCSDTCTWEPTGACADECGRDRRTTPAWAEEICIPAGTFIRGEDTIFESSPEAEIMMSAYYIDRYPVTNLRYRACVEAGACTVPMDPDGAAAFADRTRDDYPVGGVITAQAVAFCAWDGGRVLPTKARWEKAMRGDASVGATRFPWGDAMDCSRLNTTDCGAVWDGTSRNPDRYDAWPRAASSFGVGGLGLVEELTVDLYDGMYYRLASSRVPDPAGPGPGPGVSGRTMRNCTRSFEGWDGCMTARRDGNAETFTGFTFGFRCARAGTP